MDMETLQVIARVAVRIADGGNAGVAFERFAEDLLTLTTIPKEECVIRRPRSDASGWEWMKVTAVRGDAVTASMDGRVLMVMSWLDWTRTGWERVL